MRKRLYHHLTFKSKKDWIGSRVIGGTTASQICGHNKWKSKMEVYLDLTGRLRPTEINNEAVKRGQLLEPHLRALFGVNFPQFKVLNPRSFDMYVRNDKPYMTATLDGRLIHKITKKKYILEIKTHDIRNRADEEEWNNTIPSYYFDQIMWYLAVMTDYEGAYLEAHLNFYDYFNADGKKLLRTEIRYYYYDRRDEEIARYIKYIENTCTQFWEENIVKGIPPKTTIEF